MEIAVRRWISLIGVAASLAVSATSRAEERVVVTGYVIDSGGAPVANAIVAIYDDGNHVVDYARTSMSGRYMLNVPQHVLHLHIRHGKSLFGEVVGPVTRVVGGALRVVGVPLRAGMNTVAGAEAANMDPVSRGGVAAGTAVADTALIALTPRQKRAIPQQERKEPGRALIKVVAPNRTDLLGVDSVYWLQKTSEEGGRSRLDYLAGWMDPVQLRGYASDKPSDIESQYLKFSDCRLEPSLAEPGDTVTISVRLPLPPAPDARVTVVAKDLKTGEMWELAPAGGDRYESQFDVRRNAPRNDQSIVVIAYADDGHGRSKAAESRIASSGLWDVKRPYLYNPMIVASRNRAELILTVLAPRSRRR
ncbi:MAG TPA: carboxypeptidase-like regulatory domain-containing protein [Chthonomonadales bacterium]|nr:carboxypeptidase-like regulatory domain-containing protein [Chthonomonadales bacterium]